MAKLLVWFTILLTAASAQAGLLEARVQAGSRQGQSLFSEVSLKVSSRAVENAFRFFDQYNGKRRSAIVYSIVPEKFNSSRFVYDCDSSGVVCNTEFIQQDLFANKRYMVIFDLNQSAMTPRLHIVDLLTAEVTSLFASHGEESSCAYDKNKACTFISHRDSKASPLGFFATSHSYFGEVGWTIPLVGLQSAIPGSSRNDVPSTIVIHGAKYASPEFRRTRGFMGRSHGCPALSYDDIAAWKDRLQDGALFYFFHDSLPREIAPVSYLLPARN